MTWQPITREMLDVLLSVCLNAMGERSIALFQQYHVEPYLISCIRTPEIGQEMVYVVARFGEKVLIFDDVEDEFGIGIISQNELLENWRLYGTLEAALNML